VQRREWFLPAYTYRAWSPAAWDGCRSRTERLKFAKTMWLHSADKEHSDSDYIHIESEAGEDLGGSDFAGSLINVKGGAQ
jgi:hypothetical protein